MPVKKGDSWKLNSKVGTQTVTGEFKIKDDKEKMKVPAGEFEAVLVEGVDLDVAGAKTTVQIWFVKDKGIVKLYYKIAGNETTLELTEFTEPVTAASVAGVSNARLPTEAGVRDPGYVDPEPSHAPPPSHFSCCSSPRPSPVPRLRSRWSRTSRPWPCSAARRPK